MINTKGSRVAREYSRRDPNHQEINPKWPHAINMRLTDNKPEQ